MKSALLAISALASAACSQPQAPATASVAPAPPTGCTAQAAHDWSAVGSQYYVIEAEANGDDCATATAIMRIRSRDGAVLFERSYEVTAAPSTFRQDNDQTGLRNDLEGWTQNAAEIEIADWLPQWPAHAGRPPHFQPAVNRARYEAARGTQGPLFCFPDGERSLACVAMAGDNATLLGSLTPEGE